MIAPPQTLEIRITREFDAPPEDVFRAWTVPSEIAAWYGPAQFDTPEDRIHVDLRVGGRYELTMVRRDTGEEMPTGYEILELDPPTLLVLRSDPMPELGMPEAVITRVELHDIGGRTRMELIDGLYPEGFGHAEAGWNSSFDRLAAKLEG
ncbi:SRPBCC family protein [Solirubrobacter soli]|uniref:SRPBCC family protein n=1 Tax=Solirubrobacter soli TaxID=363832 RepID=UPI0003F58000|nr:SRPBCC domain-containing protein [Solirubrobacter soli]